jgi:uncharacterized membrane protein SpoIIM required for sporulation
MVLESLFDPVKVRQHPLLMLTDGIILSTVALWFSFLVFPSSASVLSIAFIVIGSVPLFHRIFVLQEESELLDKTKNFFERHFSLIAIYGWFFIGLVISFSFWYYVLPAETTELCVGGCFTVPSRNLAFAEQEKTLEGISSIHESLSGNATAVFNEGVFMNYFIRILFNNTGVLLLAILSSFVYGAGALFLISWNASVIAVKIAQSTLPLIQNYAHLGGLPAFILAYLNGLFNALGFLPHGIFELPGFFIGAIAGGIISVAMSKKVYRSKEFQIIITDAIILIAWALAFVFLGALIEAYLIAML